MYRVLKRDGVLVDFDVTKISNAIEKSFVGCNKQYHPSVIDMLALRTTVVKEFHDAASFEGIAEWIKGADNYYLQGFVDRETVMYSGLGAYSKEEMETFQDIVKPHVKHIEIRGL